MAARDFINGLIGLPRHLKRAIVIGTDALILSLSVWFAFYLRTGDWWWPGEALIVPMLTALGIGLPMFISAGFYRSIFRFSGLNSAVSMARTVAFYGIFFAGIYTVWGFAGVPRTIGLIQPILVLLLIGASRAVARMLLAEPHATPANGGDVHRVLIYGAGSAGRQLAGAIKACSEMVALGFVDDNSGLWGQTLNGLRIIGPNQLASRVAKDGITDILLAIPSATRVRRSEIVRQLRDLNLHVRTLPSVIEIARGEVSMQDLKDLDIEDLLGREPVAPNLDLLQRDICGKIVLVSGAGGSIGSELCRQIFDARPALLLLVEMSEFNLYAIHEELQRRVTLDGSAPVLIPLLASVQDKRRMAEILRTWRPDTIYHAAAYKHVPLVEHNIVEGVRNNVFGTLNLATLAAETGVPNFVLISTDKAVRPTNAMGTTKRLGEMILQALHAGGGETRVSMVRFGNVLGSSGSVVPLFRKQIAEGGPVTITHADITRYFMTIPEAAQLVLQAGAMGAGGDVFVLDMGEPVRIQDLARNMIELSGLSVRDADNPDGEIEIKVVGLRPGEKLYEELLIGDNPTPTEHARILRARESFLPWSELKAYLAMLEAAVEQGDAARARSLLRSIVPEFAPSSDLVDWVARARSTGDAEADTLAVDQAA